MVQYDKKHIELNMRTAHNSGHIATLRSAKFGFVEIRMSAIV